MRRSVLSKFIIGFAVCAFACFFAGCSASDEELLSETKSRADTLLTDSGYSFTEIKTEFKNTLTSNDKEYKIYSLTISLETENAEDYESVWGALTVLDSSDYDMYCFTEASITIMEYVSYEGNLYRIDSLNSWALERVGDYSFKYIADRTPHPALPYVGMSEELINFTGLGEYESRNKKEGDSQHKHWVTYTYYFYENGKISYIVVCENGYVKSVTGPND